MNWDQLPGRTPSKKLSSGASRAAFFKGKRVLVTGAGGCIGGALAHELSLFDPEQLLLVDTSEQGIYELQRQFNATANAGRITSVLGNICDAALLTNLFEGHKPQIILHAAAFKHVPLLEQNPFAAIANNSLATATLARLADAHACEHLLLVSTDKAADPVSIMGASKRIAETILFASTKSGSKMRMTSVRLGNVLNSPGSIVPLFTEQIAAGQPMTVTHPEVERYFLTIEEATTALLEAAFMPNDGQLLVPAMNEPVRVVDLARYMFSVLKPEQVEAPEIHYIGLRPGDKLKEVLIGRNETWEIPSEDDHRLRCIHSSYPALELINEAIQELGQAVQSRDLPRLIRNVMTIVPEYRPSIGLSARLQALEVNQ